MNDDETQYAPGWPGIPPRWTSSAKTGVGTSLSGNSRVWFTLSHGILDEVYYPRIDHACTRDMGLIVTDGSAFFSEEKRHTQQTIASLADGVPAYRLTNTCRQGRYRIEKEVIVHPRHDAVLQWTRFTPLQGTLADYHLYTLLAPHLGNRGADNTAWVGDFKGVPMLFATRDGYALALACSAPWLKRSAGFVGNSDGWQDLAAHKQMTWTYTQAENGNVALTGEIDLPSCAGEFVLSLGFGSNLAEAGHRALASLLTPFDQARDEYVREWQSWQRELLDPKPVAQEGSHESPQESPDLYRISAAMLRIHEAKSFAGGIIASLSIPWGFSKGDEDLGGYHLAWPRDLVETAVGLLAVRAYGEARRVLHYLQVTQEADGHWSQNMWIDGTPYWDGVQMDETALPILLVDQARREGTLSQDDLTSLWSMVRKAAGFMVCHGPVTDQDRWEMDPGYAPFTLAAEIAALLAAAELADLANEPDTGAFLRDVADWWNANIERWMYVTDTELDRQLGIEGHYVRIASVERVEAATPRLGYVRGKDVPDTSDGAYIVGPDALALVRFGLRAASDPRIVNTVKAIDAQLKADTPCGPGWRRYLGDQYGEHADGSPFDGSGIGRIWPLLTGERAHYELAAGRQEESIRLLRTMEAFANEGGMIPEQVWDAADIPDLELFRGQASGSAMPLVWAHAEYVKLRRSLHEGRVFDMPPQTVQRYLVEKRESPYAVWSFNNKLQTMPAGKTLYLALRAPASIHWSSDGWQTIHDTSTRDTGLGMHITPLPSKDLEPGMSIVFTMRWIQTGAWQGVNFTVGVTATEQVKRRK